MATDALQNARFTPHPQLAEVFAGKTLLKKGAKGDGVLAVQEALRDMGYNLQTYTKNGAKRGGPDGDWGPQTDTAVMNFQQHASHFYPQVKADGVFGRMTLTALDQLAPLPGKKAWDPGQPCKLPGSRWSPSTRLKVVVVIDEHRTFLFDDAGRCTAIYPNATGKGENRTDPGLKVVAGLLNEADARATGVRLWGDPNAFGLRIVNLSWADGRTSGEELHGTGNPEQMGQNVSHGCVRHFNEDIVPLWERMKVGDQVAVVSTLIDRMLVTPSAGAIT